MLMSIRAGDGSRVGPSDDWVGSMLLHSSVVLTPTVSSQNVHKQKRLAH